MGKSEHLEAGPEDQCEGKAGSRNHGLGEGGPGRTSVMGRAVSAKNPCRQETRCQEAVGLGDCGKRDLVAAGDMRPVNHPLIAEDSELIRHPWD